ncbi:Down syndrome cell adhesion molecule-like protein Dscam2 [Cimex lectularius]|uniref:Down syndrome cell adhesion molecule-like protein Dscam2 n=1 Tax=Cimex lectularius TaxID=79782 RepID=A0A8I6SSU6_CIMLE|nr:Down syndrome cell adhesion molecule-like protein Dscam2 [Cimex lectularius]
MCWSQGLTYDEVPRRGPSFLMEPPPRLEFSNSSGGRLDCTATGSPQPTISWQALDGSPLGELPGVRRLLPNGTLLLVPFPPELYRQDVHAGIYRCTATNSVGTIISRDVHLRAVVTQSYKVTIQMQRVTKGCTAVLQCVIDRTARDLVKVVSWLQEPSFFIYPTLQGDGKYHVLPSGELLVHNVEYSDQFAQYRCRTRHRLTKLLESSSPANIRISEGRPQTAPIMLDHNSIISVQQDEGAVLVCIAQGCPPPDYRWYHVTGGYEPVPVIAGPKTRVLGPVLAIEAVTEEDGGLYRCVSSNQGGEATAEIRLNVITQMSVEISPQVATVRLGATSEFRCTVSHGSGAHLITWYKNGRVLPGRSNGELLVLDGITREDQGMYQCIARRAEGDTAQASGELQLGDAAPILMYSFIEQTLQPGPAVSLKCTSSGNPTPHITWTLDGFNLPHNSRFVIGQYVTLHGDVISHVNISHVVVEDGGEYTCTAENRAGKVSHSARLNVYGLPYIRMIPKVTAVAGEEFQIKCPVAGYPIEEIKWERGGRELPEDLRQKVISSTGLLIINPVQTSADAGVYTCWARNKQGQTARRSGEVKVIVPPKISPFSADRTLHLGERASLTCSVTKGDPPLTVTWLKDGRALDPKHRLAVQQVDQFNSILLIESLSPEHNGNYSCVARNPAAEVVHTQRLVVNVPPKWIIEPGDVSVERNKNVLMNCQAQGVPPPSITWKKATGSKSGDYEEVRDRMYTKVFNNGSLLLQNVKEDREGFYLCQAHNGIGNGIGKVIQLKVNSAPYFSGPAKTLTVKKGDIAVLICRIHGDTPISIRWHKQGKFPLTPATNYRVSLKQEMTPEGVLLGQLHIAAVEASDAGPYFCQATNIYGRDQQLVQLTVQEPPEKPSELKAVMVNSRSVNLQWAHQTGEPTEVTKYIIQYKEAVATPWKQVELSGQLRGALVEGLKPATKYIMKVAAEGPAGRSGWSADLWVTTEPQRPAGPPLGISVRPISSSKLLVTWTPPLAELRHGDIQGYYVGYKEINMVNGNYNMTAVTGDGEDGTGELVLTGLAQYTRYTIVVQAFNQVGRGPLSEPVSAQTLEDVPSAPPEVLRCTALSSQSLQVSWQPPPAPHCNGIILGYKLQYDTQNPEIDVGMETIKTSALTYILPRLQRYTNYTMQVLAFTRVGDGPFTKITYCHTDEDVPGSPGDIKVVVSSPQSLLVSWLPPHLPNGIISKYTLYTRVVDGQSELNHSKRMIPAVHNSYEAKGLQHHVEYQFWVTASTRVGEGPSSRVVAQVPSNRVPARISSFHQVVRRPWHETVAMPCATVGIPVPRRQWYKNDIALQNLPSNNLQVLESGELVVADLSRSDTDNYTCHADNGIGSDRIYYTLIVQVPPSPPILYVTSATSNSVLLHWKPGDNGAAPILGYTLYYKKTHSDPQEIPLSRRTTSYELKGLSCGSTYSISLSTFNKLGPSQPSPSLPVRTQGQFPGVPSPSTFLQANSTSVILKLQVWPDNGCPILSFVVRYKNVNDLEWILVSNNVKPQKKFTVTGLLSATEYNLQVEAQNIAGSSVGEFQFFTLTKDGELPPPELVSKGHYSRAFYTDIRVMIPLLVAIASLFIAATTIVFCHRTRQARTMKETLDNQQNAEAQRERYYATIHKVALQSSTDKIPETSEDISPYATFQLTDPNSTLLHSFMYHEQAMQEQGCTSAPPQSMRSAHPVGPRYMCSKGRRARRRSSRKTDAETDESDSDPEQITSSRTESSNHLDATIKARYIYQGPHSSTSSDISPMSEAKSLPRRGGRARLLGPGKQPMRQSLSIAETAFRGERPELSEAECDIDTLKKLKLGLRSSLWSRPNPQNPHSDYSIAV